jgi:putative FmdB family regulatory protein
MPTYQYKCLSCGQVFEVFQKMTDPAIDKCPSCQGKADRVISGGAGFLLKGAGFYATDYRTSAYKKAAAADNGKAEVIAKKGDNKKDA